MTAEEEPCVRVLVPAGVLGWGVSANEIEAGLALSPHTIAIDAGSTDSGPAYLATGRSKYGRGSIKRDLSLLMDARRRAGIPLLIGSCGTSGCDVAVDETLEIVLEVAREQGDAPRIAVIYSEQDAGDLKARNASGLVTPLPPAGPLGNDSLDACSHIVALLGPEPYMAAIDAGADIILGGRTTDTAVLAAFPLMRGTGVAAAWHAAKVAECGGLCTINPTNPGVMMSIDRTGFTIEPLSPQNRCTPETVSAHMLYENSDPFRLAEPGGVLDVTDANYNAIDDRRVRVTGSRWETKPYTMKLEGAGGGPFQTIMLVGIEDPAVLEDVDTFVARMERGLRDRITRTLRNEAGLIELSLRPYGWNAVSGRPAARRSRAARDRPDVRGNRADAGDGDRSGQGVQSAVLPLSGARGHRNSELRVPVLARRDRARPGVRVSPEPRGPHHLALRARTHPLDRCSQNPGKGRPCLG